MKPKDIAEIKTTATTITTKTLKQNRAKQNTGRISLAQNSSNLRLFQFTGKKNQQKKKTTEKYFARFSTFLQFFQVVCSHVNTSLRPARPLTFFGRYRKLCIQWLSEPTNKNTNVNAKR